MSSCLSQTSHAEEFKKGAQVTLTRNEPLNFQGVTFKQGSKGEVFTVIIHRTDTKTVYIAAKDASGRDIALAAPETAFSLALNSPPSPVSSTQPNAVLSIRHATPEEATYLITTDKAAGSAFLGKQGARVYLFTNYHVIEAAKKITCTNTHDSFDIAFADTIEVSDNQDIVRIPVQKDYALNISTEPKINSAVSAYGNSGGENVVTKLDGKVLGVGPDILEVSCEFIQGNSGGPLVTTEGSVVGLSTFAVKEFAVPEWIRKGTRFAMARRFGVRITDTMKWSKTNFGAFQLETGEIALNNENLQTTLKDIVSRIKMDATGAFDTTPIIRAYLADTSRILGKQAHEALYFRRNSRYSLPYLRTQAKLVSDQMQALSKVLEAMNKMR